MLAALPLLASLWLAWLAPAQASADFAAQKVREATGLPLSLGRLRVRLWGGVDLHDLRLSYPTEDGRADTLARPLLAVDRVSLRYRLLPLLARRFEVRSVELVNPDAFIDPTRLESLAATLAQADSTLPDGDAPMDTSTTAQAPSPLPVGFGLSSLALEEVSVEVALPDTLPLRRVTLSGLNLAVEGLSVPREALSDPTTAQGRLRLFGRESRVALTLPTGVRTWELLLDWDLHWQKGDWSVQGGLGLAGWLARLDIGGKGLVEAANLRRLSVGLDGVDLLRAQGGLDPDTGVTLTVEGDTVSIAEVLASAQATAPEFLPPDSLLPNVEGRLQILSGQIQGDPEDLRIQLASVFSDLSVALPDTPLNLSPLSARLAFTGALRRGLLQGGRVQVSVGLDGLRVANSDSSNLTLGPLALHLGVALDAVFAPLTATVTGRWDKVLGGAIDLHGDWRRAGNVLAWPAMAGRLTLFADSLRLNALPQVPPDVEGTLGAGVEVALRSRGRLALGLWTSAEDLRFPTAQRPLDLPGLRLEGRGVARWPDLTRPLRLDSLSLALGEALSGHLSGMFDPASAFMDFSLEHLTLRNGPLWELVPEAIKAPLTGLRVTGAERLSARLRSGAEGLEITDGLLALQDVNVDWPENGMAFQNVQTTLTLAGNPAEMKGQLSMGMEEAVLSQARPEPYGGVNLAADWSFTGQDTLQIQDGRIGSDWGLSGGFSMGLDGLSGSAPRLSAQATVALSTPQAFEAVDKVCLTGTAGAEVRAAMDLAPGGRLNLSGRVFADRFHVAMDTMLALGPIRADVPLALSLDPGTQRIIAPKSLPLIDPQDYALYRDAYLGRLPGLGRITIDSLTVQGLTVGPLAVDTRIQGSQVELPWITLTGIGGNLVASVHGVAQGGRLDSLAYGLALDVARINSAALMRQKTSTDQESELNATARFSGQGIDFAREVDVSGYFYITRIGPRFASTLLEAMDPQGKDRNIRLTRRLLNMGWKPKLFSFEMRHGYVYPALRLGQPWYSPIRLPEEMALGRLPLAFFLQMTPKTP